jgi:hypothetical protein
MAIEPVSPFEIRVYSKQGLLESKLFDHATSAQRWVINYGAGSALEYGWEMRVEGKRFSLNNPHGVVPLAQVYPFTAARLF